jgi:hypothetical protein
MAISLTATFLKAIDTFNGAKDPRNYDALKQFLHPNIVMKRVNDTASVTGSQNVIDYLNSTQKGKWPQVDYSQQIDPEYIDGNIGNITGRGTYTVGETPLKVQLAFCFRRDSADSPWLVADANCTPYGPK